MLRSYTLNTRLRASLAFACELLDSHGKSSPSKKGEKTSAKVVVNNLQTMHQLVSNKGFYL